MNFSVEPCVPQDAHGIATAAMGAWCADWHWSYRWKDPSLGTLIDWFAERFPHNLTTEREKKRHQKLIENSSGEVVGYARWLLPTELAEKGAWPEAQATEPSCEDRQLYERKASISLPEVRSDEMLEFRSAPLVEADARIMKNGPYLVLEYLTVKPTFQRQGAATLLVKSGLEIADKYQQKAHVMASSAGLKLYEEQGFRIMETTSTDYSQFGAKERYVHHFMVREPFSGKNESTPS